MKETDLPSPPPALQEQIFSMVERACALAGLTITSRGTLSKYPGCIHWHAKKEKSSGVMEITWWERRKRLWIKVAANRDAAWNGPAIDAMRASLERDFAGCDDL